VNRNDRAIVGVAMLAHALVHTYELSIPILVTIWLTEFSTTTAELGLVVTVGMGLFGLGALPAGVLADHVGSKPLIAACVAGMGASFLLLSVAPSVLVIALALVCWGVAASVYHPAGLSLISTGVTERGRGLAFHGIAGNVGIAAGPLATSLLLLAFDWRTVAVVLGVPALVAAGLVLLVSVDESAHEAGGKASGPPSSWSAFLDTSKTLFAGAFVLVFGIVMMSGLYYRGVLTFLPELLSDLDFVQSFAADSGIDSPARYVYSGLLAVGVFGQYAGGRLTDRMPPERGIAIAFGVLAVLAVAFMPLAGIGAVPLLAVSAVLGFFLFVVQPMYQALVAEYSPPETRGISYGFTYLGVFGVGALGAAVAGGLLTYATPFALFLALAAFAAIASVLGFRLVTN